MRFDRHGLRRGPLLALALAAGAPTACGQRDPPIDDYRRERLNLEPAPAVASPTTSDVNRLPKPPTVDEINSAPALFYGKPVRLAGEVDEIYGERAFELEGNLWAFGDDITVLTRTPVTFVGTALAPADELIVTGLNVPRDMSFALRGDRLYIDAATVRQVPPPTGS